MGAPSAKEYAKKELTTPTGKMKPYDKNCPVWEQAAYLYNKEHAMPIDASCSCCAVPIWNWLND